ncbi:hypothetical protein EST38_g6354 [Candolleomyces aberdarensis]|uniref:F-box domain-containing protein n=1 Tax=Candolleomyces aberdarensis TaxID=2316362 RepID=A0A4Q2DIA2_9AGAR|nr:hypothetical protein EST38_g6354 [Candolleomyces aberdarensis]
MTTPAVSDGLFSNRVPEEIWREIFRLCTDSRIGPATFNPSEAPILLTHICGQWRLIAHDEEYLWTSLRARYPSPGPDDWRLQHLCNWLQRAKRKEVRLHLEQYYAYGSQEVSALFQLDTPGERLMPQVARSVKNLTSLVLIEIPQEELVSLPDDSFPVLERLVLPTKYWEHGRIWAFSDAPALRRAALEPQIADPGFMPLPWHQLTHFLEFWETEKRTWECIKQMRGIRYLAMIFPRVGKSWRWPDERLAVESLECLTVNLWDYDDNPGFQPEGIEFLRHFVFPRLKSLRLVLQHELNLNRNADWDLIEEFVDTVRQYKGLEYFSLSCANMTGIDRIFEAIPDIKTLDVHLRNQNPKDLGAFFEALTIVDDGPFQQRPLSQLKEVVIDLSTRNLCRKHWFNTSELACSEMVTLTLRNFLTSRLTAAEAEGGNFKIVFYGTDATLIKSYVAKLDDLVKAGLQLETNLLPHDNEDHECNCSRWWIYRDPELKDWPEVLGMARAPPF